MPAEQKHTLIAAFANPAASPRPRRMIERALSVGHKVSLYCLPPSRSFEIHNTYLIHKHPKRWVWRRKLAALVIGLGYQFFRTQNLREKLFQFAYGIGAYDNPFANARYNYIIVEDLFLLPYCLKHADKTKVVFDAREFYPKQREGDWTFELIERPVREWTCRTYLPRCSKIFTVSQGLSDAYLSEYGATAEVLRSTPSFTNPPALSDSTIRDPIRLIHIGVANSNRKIENMIEIFRKLEPRFTFDIYLSGNKPYVSKLKRLAANIDGLEICPPVLPDQIIPTLQKYDVSFCYFEPTTFNLKHCLPNKFFESIQARIALAIGPSPDMSKIVSEYKCGFIADSFSANAMVNALNAIDYIQLAQAKKGSDLAAETLCAENEWISVDTYLSAD